MFGIITKSIIENESIKKVTDQKFIKYLVNITNQLLKGYIENTDLFEVTIKGDYVNTPNLYTVFRQRNKANIPYSVVDLSLDINNGSVSREVIDKKTEDSIIKISKNLCIVDFISRLIVIIESTNGENYIILEGNKRVVGMHLAQKTESLPKTKIVLGKTTLSWSSMLDQHQMIENA